MSCGYSIFFVPWALGGAQYPGMAWLERWTNLSGRLAYSFSLYTAGEPVDDPLLFITAMAIAYWTLSLHAGFSLTRKASFSGSILPSGIAIFLVQIYDSWSGTRIELLALFILLSLLLLGRLSQNNRERSWMDRRVWTSTAANKDMNIILTTTAISIVLLAWLLPGSTQSITALKNVWNDITKPWKEAMDDMENAIAGLERDDTIPTADYYGSSLPLGRSGASGDTVLFTVRVPMTVEKSRFYWVVRTYDQYDDGVWYQSSIISRTIQPRNPAWLTPDSSDWTAAEFAFTIPSVHLTILPTPTRPVWVSRSANLEYIPVAENIVEPLLIRVNPPIQPGENYIVHATVAIPTRVQLRAAGSDYPEWVTGHYLQLPDGFPQEVADLAKEITEGELTPYDKAVAITNHLRVTIRYTQSITPAPDGYDPLAWFLLTSQEGFCNYYASAEVLMLRSLGIPARMAVGYSDGQQQGATGRVVRSRNAHAWPEVYFPGIGWVEFEPTSAEAPLLRPSGDTEPAASGDIGQHEPAIDDELDPENVIPFLPVDNAEPSPTTTPNSLLRITIFLIVGVLGTVGIATIILFGVGEKRRRQWYTIIRTPAPILINTTLERMSLPAPHWLHRWVHWTALSKVERAFASVYRSLRWLGIGRDPARTPAQAATMLREMVPDAAVAIDTLLHEYQLALFSKDPVDENSARNAAISLRHAVRRAAWQHRLQAIQIAIRKRKWREILPTTRGKKGE